MVSRGQVFGLVIGTIFAAASGGGVALSILGPVNVVLCVLV